jgi:hypothetical protein
LWCLWKSRNDNLFGRKSNKPFQVHAAAKAILQGARNDDELTPTKVHASITQDKQCTSLQQGSSVSEPSKLVGSVFYVDAAWSPLQGQNSAPAGIGIFIQNTGLTHTNNIFISATSPHVSSALQAEAFGVQLAVTIAELLCSEQPIFLTDNKTLSVAAAANDPVRAPGHWQIAPQLAAIFTMSAFNPSRIHHTNRQHNFKAHHQAKLALRLLSKDVIFRCLCNSQQPGICPVRSALSESAVQPFKLVSVKCC